MPNEGKRKGAGDKYVGHRDGRGTPSHNPEWEYLLEY